MTCLVILVNYHCAADTIRAVNSVATESFAGRIRVIDNSASPQEAETLRASLPTDVMLTICENNLGFAGACNLAYAEGDEEFVLLLNPDALLLPGTLQKLCSALSADSRLAAVAPATFWDEQQNFILPTLLPETPLWWFGRAIASRWPWSVGTPLAEHWLEWQQRIHGSSGAQPVDFLSGAILLLRRSAIKAAGGLFDPRYFMFFEDADLCRRLKAEGYQLALVPDAHAVHRWRNRPEKYELMAQSAPLYTQRHFPWIGHLRALSQAPYKEPFAWLERAPNLKPGFWGLGMACPDPVATLDDFGRITQHRKIRAITPSPVGFPAIFVPAGKDASALTAKDWDCLENGNYVALIRESGENKWVAFEKSAPSPCHCRDEVRAASE